jgi:Zn-dependent protease with chaperone function
MGHGQGSSGAGVARTAAALALLAGFWLAAAALIVGLAALGVAGLLDRSTWPLGLVGSVLMLGVAGAMVRGLLSLDARAARHGGPGTPGLVVEVGPRDEPDLWAEVRATALAVGVRVPDRLTLVPEVTAWVAERPRLLGLRRRQVTLGLGVGMLAVQRVSELRAVLAHELGHLAHRHGRLHLAMLRTRTAMLRTREDLGVSLAGRLWGSYASTYSRLVSAIWQRQELEADARAVQLCGQRAAVAGLESVAISAHVLTSLLQRFVVPLWRAGRHPDELYGGLRQLLLDPAARPGLDRLRAAAWREPTDPHGSHPGLGLRLAAIAALPDRPVPFDATPARSLLRDPDAAEQGTAALLSWASTGGDTVPTTWAEAAGLVYGPARERAAAALATATMAVTGDWRAGHPRHTLDVLAAGRHAELAAKLVPELGVAPAGPPPPDQTAALAVLRECLEDAVAAELVRAGRCTWAFSWPHLAVPAGGPAWTAPDELARLVAAAADPVQATRAGAAAALRRRLSAATGGGQGQARAAIGDHPAAHPADQAGR